MKKPVAAEEVAKQSDEKLKSLRTQWALELGMGPNYVAQSGAPVSFTSHLNSITPGQTQVLGTSGLANGFRTSYLIDEIRMQAYTTVPAASLLPQASYAMKFQFRTGAYAFSAVPVPMILHQPNYLYESLLESNFTANAFTVGDEARWVLAKPLWMAPGDQIQCSVQRDAVAATGGGAVFSADVTYVGRSLKPGTRGPKIRYVPWVAHYIHDFDDVFSQTTNEFENPFTHPVTTHRLIGRPLSKAASGLTLTYRTNMLPNVLGSQYAGIYIEDSLGYKITRSAIAQKFSPVGSVFDTERCSWTFNRPIGSREQLNMHFQTLGTVDAADRLFGVSMLGYREETA